MSPFVSILVTLCVVVNGVFCHHGIDEDTFMIDADDDIQEEILRIRRHVETTDDDVANSCTTTRGLPGTCAEFRSCYPNLLPVEPNDPADSPHQTGTYNQELASILLKVSGVCGADKERMDLDSLETYNQVVLSSQVQLCCPKTAHFEFPVPPDTENDTISVEDKIYASKACGRLKIDPLQLDVEAPDPPRIVNGRLATRGEFPWMVALMKGSRQFCGGSLIDNQHVLTAAHCVSYMTSSDVKSMRLLLGAHNVYKNEKSQVRRRAIRVYYHKGFNMRDLAHDVSVIKLNQPVKFSKFIQPVCLHTGKPRYDDGDTNADVAGWGTLYSGGPQSSNLRTVNVRVIKQNDCVEKYSKQPKVKVGNGMVCTHSPGKDSCQGDSGGPLTIHSRNQAKQIGLVSWGIGCAKYPGVYTRVNNYLKWIRKNSK